MTFAWYGHLKFTDRPLWLVILVELGHRLHRILLRRAGQPLGHAVYQPAELKTMQEVITLAVFAVFSVLYLGEPLTLNHAVGFALIALAPSSSSRDRCTSECAG